MKIKKLATFAILAALILLLLGSASVLVFGWESLEELARSMPLRENSSGSELPTRAMIAAIDPATATASPTRRPPPPAAITPMAPATLSPVPTSTATDTPSPTPEPTVLPTHTPVMIQDKADRTCPDPPPGKPDYDHYYLDGNPWPVPDFSIPEHLWLTKPLPGGGRFLYTEWLPYGYDAGGRYLLHNGIDSAEPQGAPILASADGTVIVAGRDDQLLYGWRCDWYGQLVVIELDDRWNYQPVYILYGHVLNISVTPGQKVSRGDQVAEVGFGGAAQLAHLHLEVRVGSNEFGSTRNPLLWLAPASSRGTIAGRLVDPGGRPWQGVAINAIGRSESTSNHTTWSYLDDPDHLINPDERWAENFVFGDLEPGEYEITVELQGSNYSESVTVTGGSVSFVQITTEAYKTPTPEPSATAE